MRFFSPLPLLLAALSNLPAQGQAVGIGTAAPVAGAALEVKSTTGGLLIPRLTATQRTNILNPPQGLMVYQTDGTPGGGPQSGFWYFAGSPAQWVYLSPVGDNLGNGVAQTNVNLNGNKLVGGTQASPSPDGVQLSPSGQVGLGLGAAAPSEQLQVDGGNLKIGRAQWSSAAQDRVLKFGDGNFVTIGETGDDDLLQLQAKEFRFNPSGGPGLGYSGNVGIGLGAAAPVAERLVVSGNVKITGTAGTDGLIFPDGTKQTTAATGGGGSLTLPYSGSASSGGPLFQIINTSSGIGLRGASTSGQGVVGRVNGSGPGQGVVGVKGSSVPNVEDAGVVGLSDDDYAVYGSSFQQTAIFGTTNGGATGVSTGAAGVQGRATTDGIGVLAESASGTALQATSSSGIAVRGETSNANAAIFGNNNSTAGNASGVLGFSDGGSGVRGVNLGTGVGVSGQSAASFGVSGISSNGSGVYGQTAAGNVAGVAGVEGTSGSGTGVLGTTSSGSGVRGEATGNSGYGLFGTATGGASGLYATASGTGRVAYFNQTSSTNTSNALEVQNSGTGSTALFNQSNSGSPTSALVVQNVGLGNTATLSLNNTSSAASVLELQSKATGNTLQLTADNPIGSTTRGSGTIGFLNPGTSNQTALIEARKTTTLGNTYGAMSFYLLTPSGGLTNALSMNTVLNSANQPRASGILWDNWQVTGSLSKAGGSFKIDHPLDPTNQYLYHSFVESPDMLNVYNGNVTLDARGEATIDLPDYFEALNRDFRYQLTPIGAAFTPYVLAKVAGNKFRIAGQPGAEVSWQVTGIRQDAWANAHRIPNAAPKEPENQGRYLHPELFGQPAARAIGYRPEPGAPPRPAPPAARR